MNSRLEHAVKWCNQREVERLLHALSTHVTYQKGKPLVMSKSLIVKENQKNAYRGSRINSPGTGV